MDVPEQRTLERKVLWWVVGAVVVLALAGSCGVWLAVRGGPMAVAHRGASGDAPENTMPAVKAALAVHGAAVEFDVQITKDGVVIGMHDTTVDRTTNGKGKVNDLEWSYIATLDAGSWKSEKFAGTRVPRLEEVLEAMAAMPDRLLLLDTKNIGAGLFAGVAAALDAAPASVRSQVRIGCWDKKCLEAATAAGLGDVPRIVITPFPVAPFAFDAYRKLGVEGFNVGLQFGFLGLCKPWTAKAQHSGFSVWVWTIDDEKTMGKVASWGVDGVVTNYPARVGGLHAAHHRLRHGFHHGHGHGHHGHGHGHHGHDDDHHGHDDDHHGHDQGQHNGHDQGQHDGHDQGQHGGDHHGHDQGQHNGHDQGQHDGHGHRHGHRHGHDGKHDNLLHGGGKCGSAMAEAHRAAMVYACFTFHDHGPFMGDDVKMSPGEAFLYDSASCKALANCPRTADGADIDATADETAACAKHAADLVEEYLGLVH
ncbi:glycerophosphodiesterase [Thecamonas trahens ATCC 50062]|uniref:Glycerophosphodiesterase n=1 Tax=Thecamonas trahens ATCC 50062 TaxID=461836 RepID=A0A0L0D7N5_THETB|nr:glycerophosphodiesterase [Thecamonas trahens ATCC 50062]KNC48402.1 glycerophosphodiesterase [Thecamonas trahens ATCC 50062]|eukprot:XP_013758519.1 glycerophosphodiesterase [Thecamonas trahens ATCC 50062]